ncbi:MAG: exodeoxyribonuclease VII large subunit [Bdellovibrionales bacterium]|nr:exodeoxyribonuclease VII large subunit [Bdellovibrionales bacterium]
MEDLPLFSQANSKGSTQPPKHLSVTELTARIRGVLEPSFQQVWVQGEVSNYRPASSGHVYFSLKDANAMIPAAVFGWGARGGQSKRFDLKDGLSVLCRGKLSIYPPRGSYQLIIDQIEPLGAGALTLAFEQLKAKLSQEGLFDPQRKRRIPEYPKRVAIITSPSGAAIRDMITVMERRAPHVQILVVPALVQGTEAPAQLIRALEVVNQKKLGDVVVLARGGGSMEDLWCFNDEGLARAIAKSALPVVSAVGHEIDFTISDFVSDLRAATPSAAAEMITGAWFDVSRRLREAQIRLMQVVSRDLTAKKTLLTHVAARLISPKDRLREKVQRCDELSMRLERAMRVRLERRRSTFEQWVGKLGALSPLRVLERGFSLVRDPTSNQVVRSSKQISAGTRLRITFHDGDREVSAL